MRLRLQEQRGALDRGTKYIAAGIDSLSNTTKVVYRYDRTAIRLWTPQ